MINIDGEVSRSIDAHGKSSQILDFCEVKIVCLPTESRSHFAVFRRLSHEALNDSKRTRLTNVSLSA